MGWEKKLLPWLNSPHRRLTAGRLMPCTYHLWQKRSSTGQFLTRPCTHFELLLLFSTFPAQVSLGSGSHLGLTTSVRMTTHIYGVEYVTDGKSVWAEWGGGVHPGCCQSTVFTEPPAGCQADCGQLSDRWVGPTCLLLFCTLRV